MLSILTWHDQRNFVFSGPDFDTVDLMAAKKIRELLGEDWDDWQDEPGHPGPLADDASGEDAITWMDKVSAYRYAPPFHYAQVDPDHYYTA